jgi:hypothetical protein
MMQISLPKRLLTGYEIPRASLTCKPARAGWWLPSRRRQPALSPALWAIHAPMIADR